MQNLLWHFLRLFLDDKIHEVWDEYLKRQGMVSDKEMFLDVRKYEEEVLSKRQ